MLFDPTEEAQDAPAGLDARTITQPGDLWNCCGHRVVCGDSTSAEGRSVLMAGSKPVLMVTDQPYGLSYDPRWREEADLGNQRQTGKVANDNRVDCTVISRARSHTCGTPASTPPKSPLDSELRDSSSAPRSSGLSSISPSGGAIITGRHEPCWHAVREGKSSNWSR